MEVYLQFILPKQDLRDGSGFQLPFPPPLYLESQYCQGQAAHNITNDKHDEDEDTPDADREHR